MSMTNLDLLKAAEEAGHEVYFENLPECKSVSFQAGRCRIGIDMHTTQAEEKVLLAHELGHCEHAGFYGARTPPLLRKMIESAANRWAYRKLTPPDEIQAAINGGAADAWELAEHFGVTYKFMCDALYYYTECCGMEFRAPEW